MNLKCIIKHDYNSILQTHKYLSDSWSGARYMREKQICNCCGNIKYTPLIMGMDTSILKEEKNWV